MFVDRNETDRCLQKSFSKSEGPCRGGKKQALKGAAPSQDPVPGTADASDGGARGDMLRVWGTNQAQCSTVRRRHVLRIVCSLCLPSRLLLKKGGGGGVLPPKKRVRLGCVLLSRPISPACRVGVGLVEAPRGKEKGPDGCNQHPVRSLSCFHRRALPLEVFAHCWRRPLLYHRLALLREHRHELAQLWLFLGSNYCRSIYGLDLGQLKFFFAHNPLQESK